MRLIDTHCHIDLYPDYEALIRECENMGIVTIAVTNTPSVFRRCKELLSGKRYLRAALGLHPELAHLRHTEMPMLVNLLSETRFVGEVGLDFVTQDTGIRDLQKKVFKKVLDECARSGDKILTIHSRRSAQEVVDMIGPGYQGKVILHWFTGNIKTMEKALSYGFYFSVNTAMVASEAGCRIINAIPMERLLTESDGPFVSLEGRPARPINMATAISHIAAIRKIEPDHIALVAWQNFKDLQAKPEDK